MHYWEEFPLPAYPESTQPHPSWPSPSPHLGWSPYSPPSGGDSHSPPQIPPPLRATSRSGHQPLQGRQHARGTRDPWLKILVVEITCWLHNNQYLVKGAPFISYANKTSPLGSVAFSIVMLPPNWELSGSISSPSKMTCRACWHSSMLKPASLSTSLRRAPPHWALPIAPPRQSRPFRGFASFISFLLFPPHWIAATIF